MVITIYAVLLLTCSSTLCVFGFLVGRCARKIPIFDEHLPRTLYRSAIPLNDCHSGKRADKDATNSSENSRVVRNTESKPPPESG